MPPPWRVGRNLGRTLYLDDECVGMLDDARLARVLVEGLSLLEELAEREVSPDGWRTRLIAWRLRVRALRLEAVRRRSPRALRPQQSGRARR